MKNYDADIGKKLKNAWETDYKKVPDAEINVSWSKFKNNLSSKSGRKPRTLYYKISGAAAVLLVLFTGYFFLNIYNPNIHIVNNSSVDKEIALPDGSLVLLKPNSKISYREKFKDVRGVDLKGQAFFDVVKDTLKEFQVTTGSTTTKVLGTTFNVAEKKGNEDVEISLYTGRVLVSVKDKAESWGIVPGESFVYSKGKAQIKKFDTNLSFESGNEFIDVNSIEQEELFKFLSRRFGYEFPRNAYTKNKQVTLRINKKDSLEQILNILSIINNIKYEMNKNSKEVQILKK